MLNYHGWIIINGSIATPKFLDYAQMIQDAAKKEGISALSLRNDEVVNLLSTQGGNFSSLETDTLPDFAFFIDKDIYLARQLEQHGVRVFNSSKTIEISDDKIYTYQMLQKSGLPIPKTIIAPKKYTSGSFPEKYIEHIINELGFPMIVKEAFGSFGEQVHLIENRQELMTIIAAMDNRPFVFQEYMDESKGRDVRIQIVGNKAVTAVERQNKHDFRANVTNGGKMLPYTPTKEIEKTAIEAAKAIGADFAGVDLLFDKENRAVVCEINANAHIRNLYACTGVNAADNMMQYIKKEMMQ